MKKILLISSLLGANLFALTIDDAVNLALKNNYSIQKQSYILKENQINLKRFYSNYKPKADIFYSYNSRDKISLGQLKDDSTLSAKISFNLFKGLGDKYNIKALENIYDASKLTQKAYSEDITLLTKQSYINYLLLMKQTKTLEESYKLYKEQYKDSKNFFEQGLIAKNELLEVEIEMLNAEQILENSKLQKNTARDQLENLLVQPLDKFEPIEEIGSLKKLDIIYDEQKIERRSELKALELLKKNYQNKRHATDGSFMPKVDTEFSYNRYGEGANLNSIDGYLDNQTIGTVKVSWNLYNGDSDRLEKNLFTQKINQLNMDILNLKQEIKLQYKESIQNYKLSIKNLNIALKALDVSKLNYEIVEDKLQEGLVKNKELLDANYLLTNSKQNYYNAFYKQYLAIAELERVIETDL